MIVNPLRNLVLAVAWASIACSSGCATAPAPVTKLVKGRIVTARSVDPQAYAHVARAYLYEDEERWEDAAAELATALVFDDERPELHARRSEILLHAGKVDEAAREATESERKGTSIEGLTASGHVLQARGDTKGAAAALRRAVETLRADADAAQETIEGLTLEFADAQIMALDVEGGQQTLDRLCKGPPLRRASCVRAGAVAWALGDVVAAEARYRDALTADRTLLDAHLALAWLFAASGRSQDAQLEFREALELSEGALDVGTAFARCLVAEGALDEARLLADEIGGKNAAWRSLLMRVSLERAVGRFERALAIIDDAARDNKAAPTGGDKEQGPSWLAELALERATILVELGRRAEGIAALLAVPKNAPTFVEARLRLVPILVKDGRAAEAAEALAVAQPRASQHGRQRIDLALAAALVDEKLGLSVAALQRLDRAIEQHPGESHLLLSRAATLERMGQWQQALAAAEAVLAKAPSTVEALNFAGFIAADHDHDLPLARLRLAAALALQPGSGAILDSLGWVHFRAGDLQRAALFLEQAGRLEPEDPEVWSHLGELYARRAEVQRAATMFKKALSLKPDEPLRKSLEKHLAEQLARLPAQAAPR